MKKWRFPCLLLCALLLMATLGGMALAESSAAANGRAVVRVRSVSLNAKKKTLYSKRATFTLVATIKPANATNQAVRWTTNDKSVATVDAKGVVTPVKSGRATITCRTLDGNKKAVCYITVKPVLPTSVELAALSEPLAAGDSVQMTATVYPLDATNKRLIWRSNNTKVASVDANGVVTGVAPGTARISCTTYVGGFKAIQPVTVVRSGATYRAVLIGQEKYATPLEGPHNDLYAVYQALTKFKNGSRRYTIKQGENLTGAQIRQHLRNLAGGLGKGAVKEGDVSLFFFSGHGSNLDGSRGALMGVDGDYVTVDEVQKLLDPIPGTVVVILDCRMSGQYIESKSTAAQARAAQTFNQSVVNAFSRAAKALPDSEYGSKYKILTSCGPEETSYTVYTFKYPIGLFSNYFTRGVGYDIHRRKFVPLYADASEDGIVTLAEAYAYTQRNAAKYMEEYLPTYKGQTTMVWPEGDYFPLFMRK